MRHQRSFLWVLLIALLPLVNLKAQTNTYNLKACLDYTLENHPSSTIYKNEVRISKQKTLEYISPYLPQIYGSVTFDDNLKRQTSIIPAGSVGNPTDIKVQFGTQYNTNAMLQVDQAIFDQTMIYADPGIKATNKVADINVLKNNETLIYNTAISYYKALIANEQQKLLTQNQKKFEDLIKVLQLQYDQGALKKVDLDRIKVSLNNINSQLILIRTNYELAVNTLKNNMGMEMESSITIEDSVNYKIDITMPETKPLNFKNRYDYQILNANIDLQSIDMRRKKTAFLPSLSAYARYGGQTFGNNFSTSFNNWFDYSSIGLKLNVPLFSGLRRHSQYMQSKFSLDNAKLNLKITENNMKLQEQNAQTQLLSSFNNLNSNKENLSLAKEVFDNTTLQYQQGAASLSDFLNADYSYKEAQSNYITSLINFLSSRLDYEKAQGTLINYINTL
jgi:outer membrane protein